jgi:uncharacterized membrane protein
VPVQADQERALLRRNAQDTLDTTTDYLPFITGVVISAVKPALQRQDPTRALVYGASFGFFAYSAYDLTNPATAKDLLRIVTLVYLVCSTALCGAVAWASHLVSIKL